VREDVLFRKRVSNHIISELPEEQTDREKHSERRRGLLGMNNDCEWPDLQYQGGDSMVRTNLEDRIGGTLLSDIPHMIQATPLCWSG